MLTKNEFEQLTTAIRLIEVNLGGAKYVEASAILELLNQWTDRNAVATSPRAAYDALKYRVDGEELTLSDVEEIISDIISSLAPHATAKKVMKVASSKIGEAYSCDLSVIINKKLGIV